MGELKWQRYIKQIYLILFEIRTIKVYAANLHIHGVN